MLLTGSIICNYRLGLALTGHGSSQPSWLTKKKVMILGVSGNLVTLGYFKYANFFVDNANLLFAQNYHLEVIILPLAISFFTFQQITYLVDAYRGVTVERKFLPYCLFVAFFPQLIAGPIVHHKEMLPQFSSPSIYKFEYDKIAIGFSIFIVGLFKKVVIADSVALYSTPMFDAAQHGVTISFFEAWGGALAYTFQLYFDFSGYSDMAVGLAYLFGIRLVLNFYSPYKSRSIIEFWRRWHISLSRFLRDYLYIPLGGNRHGKWLSSRNLIITMLLGGLWHGAGWTFIIWGGLHGLYLIVNRSWRTLRAASSGTSMWFNLWCKPLARILTFVAIVVGWVFFRASSFDAAVSILEAMIGKNGFILPPSYLDYLNHFFALGDSLRLIGWRFENNVPLFQGPAQVSLLALLLIIVWYFPNTHQIFGRASPMIDSSSVVRSTGYRRVRWQPRPTIALVFSLLFLAAIFKMDLTSEFLYFQF